MLISVLTSLKIDTTTKMHPVIYGLETGENRVFNGGNAAMLICMEMWKDQRRDRVTV